MSLSRTLQSLLAIICCLVCPSPASAQLIAYDPFNHSAPFQLNGTASSGGGAVWPNSPQNWHAALGNGGMTVSGNLSYGPLVGAGNMAQMQGFTNEENASVRSLGSNRGGGGNDLWLSFMMASDPTGMNGVALFNNSNTNPGYVALFGTSPTGTTPQFGMYMYANATGTGSGSFQFMSQPVLVDSATHFIAVHMQLGSAGNTNTVTMYIDPDFSSLGNGSGPTGGSSVSYTTATDFAFNEILLANFSRTASTAAFDELRFGTSWDSVSMSFTPVPEPTGLLLASVVGCVLLRKRCLRRRTP